MSKIACRGELGRTEREVPHTLIVKGMKEGDMEAEEKFVGDPGSKIGEWPGVGGGRSTKTKYAQKYESRYFVY